MTATTQERNARKSARNWRARADQLGAEVNELAAERRRLRQSLEEAHAGTALNGMRYERAAEMLAELLLRLGQHVDVGCYYLKTDDSQDLADTLGQAFRLIGRDLEAMNRRAIQDNIIDTNGNVYRPAAPRPA